MTMARKKFTPKGMTCDCIDMFRIADSWLHSIRGKIDLVDDLEIKKNNLTITKSIDDDANEMIDALKYMIKDCRFPQERVEEIRKDMRQLRVITRDVPTLKSIKKLMDRVEQNWENMLLDCERNNKRQEGNNA